MDLFSQSSGPGLAADIPDLHLGTQGWSYGSWVGPFYPRGIKPGQYLSEYAKHFQTVELDTTFYHVPRYGLVDHWNDSTPDGFTFSAKFPKVITHEKRLLDCEQEVDSFLGAMVRLRKKLGPLVLQFEYTFRADQFDLLAAFLGKLPEGYRYAVEVRHRSWLKDEFFSLLADRGVALVLADYAYMPRLEKSTADFVYVRWLGNRKAVPDDHYEKVILDRTKELLHWSRVINGLLGRGLRVYGYFNNHYMGHSPESVRLFLEIMGQRIRGENAP